uniref:Uncharacterized protein n=1 Tax=Meloidogyne enterolobii TaxID=390850 RepID=A0A6V7TXF4_MELEN|nr:unnamed protein product [Meloidogyne enterolobii]
MIIQENNYLYISFQEKIIIFFRKINNFIRNLFTFPENNFFPESIYRSGKYYFFRNLFIFPEFIYFSGKFYFFRKIIFYFPENFIYYFSGIKHYYKTVFLSFILLSGFNKL